MVFTINKNVVFIDSKQFMNSTLDKLVKNLSDVFKHLTWEFGFENLNLLKQKDAYPYECKGSFERFPEKKLPDQKHFYRSLKDGTTNYKGEKLDGHITDKEYLTCIKIWNGFNMKNMVDYQDHYLKKDVLLLADVLKKFTNESLKSYKLDPFHYFSSPGLSWDAILKMTERKLELISDMDKHLFIEKGLRRGISYICKRFSEANNKNTKSYDPAKENNFIMYLYMAGE